jgi:hypothetical protein
MKTRPILLVLFFLVGSFFLTAAARQGDPSPGRKSVFEHLTAVDGARLTLELDLTTIIEQKKTNNYFPAQLTTESGEVFRLEVKPRGKFRRKKADLPPLKLKFPKKALVAAGFDTLNEIKLVLPWSDKSESDELIIREYLVYRMFEHLTQASVKARLVRLNLMDTHVEKSKMSVYAMLVEDDEITTARLNGRQVERYGLPADSLIMNQAALVAVFEYMIGNTDWDISMMRNVRLIQSTESEKILVVPYDFDFSGLVNAPYASPSSESGLRMVRERFLMANGITPEALKKATQVIKSAKDDLYAICRSKHLSRQATTDMINYLETFFMSIEENDEFPAVQKIQVVD